MAAHVRHELESYGPRVASALNARVNAVASDISRLKMRYKCSSILEVLTEISRETKDTFVVSSSLEGLDACNVRRRVHKSVRLHLGGLLNLFRHEKDLAMHHIQSRGEKFMKLVNWNEALNPMKFLDTLEKLDSSVKFFPVLLFMVFMVRAVICRSASAAFHSDSTSDVDQRERAIRITHAAVQMVGRNAGVNWAESADFVKSIELFELWDTIVPATLAYDSVTLAQIETSFDREVNCEGLLLPETSEAAIYADHCRWISTAEHLTGRPLPRFLNVLCRSYAEAVSNCVDIDSGRELEREEELRSYTCFKHRGAAPQVRCVHLQTVILDIWEKLASFADDTISVMSNMHNVAFDAALEHVTGMIFQNVSVLIIASQYDAGAFREVHPRMWLSLGFDQLSYDVSSECAVCAQGLQGCQAHLGTECEATGTESSESKDCTSTEGSASVQTDDDKELRRMEDSVVVFADLRDANRHLECAEEDETAVHEDHDDGGSVTTVVADRGVERLDTVPVKETETTTVYASSEVTELSHAS